MVTILKMVPEGYHQNFSFEVLANQRDFSPFINQTTECKIIPYLDARFIENDIEQKIMMYRDLGFRGLKLLHIPEEDTALGIRGMEHAFNRNPKESERITSLLIESAANQGMSVLLHVDLRKHGDFILDMIKKHPVTNFNIPHFGFSRRKISSFLENYPNCYTDLSSLTPFMRKDPMSYKTFIKRYQDRILFGSDALIGQPVTVLRTMQFVTSYLNDPELCEKIFRKNYLAFHNS
jgi:predicted TIM-barrel fold metal-dependent hydrolase